MYNSSTPFLFIPFFFFFGNWYIFSGVQQEINAPFLLFNLKLKLNFLNKSLFINLYP